MSGHLSSPRVVKFGRPFRSFAGIAGCSRSGTTCRRLNPSLETASSPELGVRPGGIVEWLVARQGAGAFTSALQIMAQSSAGRWNLGGCGSRSESSTSLLCPAGASIRARVLLLRPATRVGNVLGDRAMPAMSRSVGHVGLGRRADSRAGSSPLATGGGSRRGSGFVFSAGHGETGARLGRLTIAGHAAGWRPGGNQAVEYRGAVSPGRPGRQRPGVGDRPCRGSCASGSRGGQSSDCECARPELDRSELVLFAGQNQRPLITVCSFEMPNARASDRSTAGRGQSAAAQSRLPSC